MNNKNHALSIFVDLSKAFDTINHEILLSKLFLYGIRAKQLDWFSSFLTDRKQYVRVGNSCSTRKSVKIRVPQGSVLGPILFILYMNDLTDVSKYLSCILFADDTTFSFSNYCYQNLVQIVNVQLDKIKTWIYANKLSINVVKTFSMLFPTDSMILQTSR